MIDVPLENAINMRSVWMAWLQFWGKQHLLHIDVLFFHNIVNVEAKKALKCNDTLSSYFCAKLPDGHLQFKSSILHSNVNCFFYSKNIWKKRKNLTALLYVLFVQQQYVLNAHSSVSAYVLAVASSCTCLAAAAAIIYNSNNQQQQP